MLEIIFQYGPLTLRTFNLFIALGLFFAGAFAIRYTIRRKLNSAFLYKNILYIILSGFLMGRFVYILEHLQTFLDYPLSMLFVWDLHLSFFGGLYGLILALAFFSYRHKENFWSWFDILLLSLLAFLFFIHLGHFFNGTQYGKLTDLPWGIAFDNPNIRYLSPIHPTQLYSALLTLMVVGYTLKRSRRIHLPGVVGCKALVLYCLGMYSVNHLHAIPSFYNQASYLALATLGFVAWIHTSHKTYINE